MASQNNGPRLMAKQSSHAEHGQSSNGRHGLVNVVVTTVSLQLLIGETGRRFVTTPLRRGGNQQKLSARRAMRTQNNAGVVAE
jgi:hypothetical protein